MKRVLFVMLLTAAVPTLITTQAKAERSECCGCCDRCGCNAFGRILAAPATLGLSLFTLGCPDCNQSCCSSCGSCC